MKLSTNGMQHTPATATVFQSDDYNKFRMIKGNREIDLNKIKRILSDIERGTNLIKYCPILVVEKNNKLDIVDGQHRYMISKKLKLPVFYIIAEELSLYDIARMNSNTEKWKAKDFINCYIELGNQHYSELKELLQKYPGLNITTGVSLLSKGKVHHNPGNKTGSTFTSDFQTGKFEVKYKAEAIAFLEKINQFNFQFKYSRPFMQAIEKVINAGKYSIGDLIEKVNEDPSELRMHGDYKNFLVNLEQIANKRVRIRVIIH